MILEHLKALTEIVDPAVPASLDPRDVNPPAAWISGRRAEDLTLAGDPATIVCDIYLVARDAGIPDALEALEAMSTALTEQLAAAGVGIESIALDEAVTLPTGGGPLPAYRFTVKI